MIRLVFALALAAGPAAADSVTNAYKACQAFDQTGLSTAPCEVSGWGQKVIATIDKTPEEARILCGLLAQKMDDAGAQFDAGWQLVLKSPYSGDNSIAFCALPS